MRCGLIKTFVTVYLLFDIFSLSFVQAAARVISSRQQFCWATRNKEFFQTKLLFQDHAQLAIRNRPGLIGKGVCWWHSRFTRAATYLAVFRPDIISKPTPNEALRIIRDLIRMNQLVEIFGYPNLQAFSRAYAEILERELTLWSLRDVFNLKILNAFGGESFENPVALERRMDRLYERVTQQGRIEFQTLQLPGLSTHAWLVVAMRPTSDGYHLVVIDSNFAKPEVWTYQRGQNTFRYAFSGELPLFGPFIPYSNKVWQREEDQLRSVVRRFCR